uniref:DUF4218 domain-containing protein n=1 Tax=Chenopodium quinoa TaxID=63459 RepID=A0A803MD09_CHEQI
MMLKIAGYKSHDAHFMMNYLLPIAVKTTLPKDVASPLIRLCAFFKGIWSKTIDPRDLGKLQFEIAETLCLLERIFPPAFFDIMEHLPIHLVDQSKLGGHTSTPENENDDSTSEYDGENEVETDNIMDNNLTSGKRKPSKQVSKQVNKSSLRPKTMADVVEVNSPYLKFRKKQKENNEAFVASNQSLNKSLTRKARICGAACNENDNDDVDALSEIDEADALNENDDDVGNEYEGDQELEDEVLSQYGREGMQ